MIQAPDLLIYLRAEIPKLIEQISRRGRSYESSISIKYLEDLNRSYEEWIAQYTEGPLLVIDVNQLDYVNRPEDFQHIVDLVDAKCLKMTIPQDK